MSISGVDVPSGGSVHSWTIIQRPTTGTTRRLPVYDLQSNDRVAWLGSVRLVPVLDTKSTQKAKSRVKNAADYVLGAPSGRSVVVIEAKRFESL